MTVASLIEALVKSGAAPEMILAAVKAVEEQEALEREKQRLKKRAQREKLRNINDPVPGQSGTDGDIEGQTGTLKNYQVHIENARAPDSLILDIKKVSKRSKRSKRSKITASRFALDAIPPEWVEYCKSKRPDLDPFETFDAFRDWWIAQPGGKGLKLDWTATWRTWIRNQNQKRGNGHGGNTNHRPDKHQQIVDATRQALAAHRAARGDSAG